MKLIHALKYKGRVELARPLGQLLFSTFIRYWVPERIDLIMPVPLHVKRFRKRGFNQAFLLISKWPALAKDMGFTLPNKKISRDVLVKNRHTDRQTGLDRASRKKNVKNAFSLKKPGLINGKRILVVDDVYTTGATLNACTNALKNAGASRIIGITAARAGLYQHQSESAPVIHF